MIGLLRQLLAAMFSFILGVPAFSNSYDNVANLQRVTYPNGVAHNYAYDTRNRLTNLGVNKASTPIASYAHRGADVTLLGHLAGVKAVLVDSPPSTPLLPPARLAV